jgi:hypothetical protein
MKTLTELGVQYNTDKATDHFFTDVYDKIFNNLRTKKLNILEIGIFTAGSIKMWKDYFSNSQIYATDIEDKTHYIEDRIFIEQGDQTDVNFMTNVFSNVEFDIIIDDGGHTMEQQQITLETMLPRLKSGGIFVVEDLHSSFYEGYGGGVRYHLQFQSHLLNRRLLHELICGPLLKHHPVVSYVMMDIQ